MASSSLQELARPASQRKRRATLRMEEAGPQDDGISPDRPPPASSSNRDRIRSGDRLQHTNRDTKSTSSTPAILHVVFSSSQQDDVVQYTPDEMLAGRAMTNHISQSSPMATRSTLEPSALFVMFGRTRWRLLNSLFLLAVGTAKSVSAYQNASTAANTLDLVIGIFWALLSYWFSNLEVESPNVIPWLFKRPSEQELTAIVMLFFLSFGLLAVLSLLYLWLFPVLLVSYFFDALLKGHFVPGLRLIFTICFQTVICLLLPRIVIGIIRIFLAIKYPRLPSISIPRMWFRLRSGFHRNDWDLQLETDRSLFYDLFRLSGFLCYFALAAWVFGLMQVDTASLAALYVSILLIVGLFLGYLVLGLVRMTIRLLNELFTYIRTCGFMTPAM